MWPSSWMEGQWVSYSANLRCSHCYCSFSTDGLQRNYSCIDWSLWKTRNNQQHRQGVSKLTTCTPTERAKTESKLGCRFSVLLDLPYFDPVYILHMLVYIHSNAQPLPRLCKVIRTKILINTDMLDNCKLILVNKRLQSVHIPFHIGRLPTKIGTGTTFTAHQWMNWTLYFRLHGLIPQSHLEC